MLRRKDGNGWDLCRNACSFAGGGDGGLLFDAFRGFTGSQFAGESVDFPPQLCVVCGVGYLRHDGNALKGGAEALNLFG